MQMLSRACAKKEKREREREKRLKDFKIYHFYWSFSNDIVALNLKGLSELFLTVPSVLQLPYRRDDG